MELNTVEKFLLLAHHPKRGRFVSSLPYINAGFAGSIYLELAILDKISIKKRRVFVKNNDKIIHHPILSEVLEEIEKRKSPRSLKSWILSLYHKKGSYIWGFLEGLERKGLIRIEDKKLLWLFPYKKSFLINESEQQSLILELKYKITKPESINVQDRALFGLIEACKLYPNFYSTRNERKELEKQIKVSVLDKPSIMNSIDDAVHQTIKITIATMFITVYYVGMTSSR